MDLLIPHLVAWAVLTTVVVFLAIYRRKLDFSAEEILHGGEDESEMARQGLAVAERILTADRWGRLLTVASVAYGAVILALYLFKILRTV